MSVDGKTIIDAFNLKENESLEDWWSRCRGQLFELIDAHDWETVKQVCNFLSESVGLESRDEYPYSSILAVCAFLQDYCFKQETRDLLEFVRSNDAHRRMLLLLGQAHAWVSGRAISEFMGINWQVVGKILDSLIWVRLVETTPAADQSENLFSLTEEGWELLARLEE